MKPTHLITLLIAWLVLGAKATPTAADTAGVAIAIVYDTSGSMSAPVHDEVGKAAPKYLIANRRQIYATNGAAENPRNIQAGLFTFKHDKSHVALPFGPFDVPAFTAWAQPSWARLMKTSSTRN